MSDPYTVLSFSSDPYVHPSEWPGCVDDVRPGYRFMYRLVAQYGYNWPMDRLGVDGDEDDEA